jgi:hypothetical protein
MHELIAMVALILIPGGPLAFTWVRFLQRGTARPCLDHLTLEIPLFVVTGSFLFFFAFLTFLFLFVTPPLVVATHIRALIWSNVGVSLAMTVLTITGNHPLRWRLAGSAAAVFFVWLAAGLSILAVEAAGRWVL